MSTITQSVISTNFNCNQDPKFNSLKLLRSNPKLIDLIGRTNGDNIKFDQGLGGSYFDLKMRRKAEILQYKNNINTNSSGYDKKDSQIFNDAIKGISPNGYSKYRLKHLNEINNDDLNCGRVIGNSPSSSGIWFNDKSEEIKDGLYFDKNIRFFLRL
jgi:hypothetical protein